MDAIVNISLSRKFVNSYIQSDNILMSRGFQKQKEKIAEDLADFICP